MIYQYLKYERNVFTSVLAMVYRALVYPASCATSHHRLWWAADNTVSAGLCSERGFVSWLIHALKG